ncbi:sodium channel protein 60E-like isoform X2 [Harmonia axyridis]|uniref:sodium channel protein 60E-like isoform X2 n=1 Tax=Harmonia axyridis TaxID=115357 RepID=UPI001E279059|nr:sodium channel protein 60E-like isoform X2 [Harmonia axyridis]
MSSSPTTPPTPASSDFPSLPPRPNEAPAEELTVEDAGDRTYEPTYPLDEPSNKNEEPSDHLLEHSDPGECFTHSDPLLDSSDRLLNPKHLTSESSDQVRPKRPLSYPWGPDSKPDSHTVEFKLSTSQSETLKPSLTRSRTQVKPFTRESLERLEKKTLQLVREYGFTPRKKLSVEDGSRLPSKFEPFPPHLYGRPLEEIDNFIYDETFCVVSKRFRKNYIHRFTATSSFFFFSPFSRVRKTCIYLSTNQFFDYMVMATILLNCVFLAMAETIEEAE